MVSFYFRIRINLGFWIPDYFSLISEVIICTKSRYLLSILDVLTPVYVYYFLSPVSEELETRQRLLTHTVVKKPFLQAHKNRLKGYTMQCHGVRSVSILFSSPANF